MQRRRSIRLHNYDYSQAGAYFVTICTHGRKPVFESIQAGKMVLGASGEMVLSVWRQIPLHCRSVDLDQFVVMPNHVHGIVVLDPTCVGAGHCACPDSMTDPKEGQPQWVAPTISLPTVIHLFKPVTTAEYFKGVRRLGWDALPGRLWQRNYYEHVIRGDQSLDRIREYIARNPLTWEFDKENPKKMGSDPFDRWLATFKYRPRTKKSETEMAPKEGPAEKKVRPGE